MAISGDYPKPVMVNGFSCKNCTEVDRAKKHIDPAHPEDGPYGATKTDKSRGDAVAFGGRLSELEPGPVTTLRPAPATGSRLDISA